MMLEMNAGIEVEIWETWTSGITAVWWTVSTGTEAGDGGRNRTPEVKKKPTSWVPEPTTHSSLLILVYELFYCHSSRKVSSKMMK
jgi:hypothetical protein